MKSFLTHLGHAHTVTLLSSAGEAHRTCAECGKVLYPRYDLQGASAALKREDLKGRRSEHVAILRGRCPCSTRRMW